MRIRAWLLLFQAATATSCLGVAFAGCGRNADLGGPGGGGDGGTLANAHGDASLSPDGSVTSDQDAAPIALADLCPLYTEDLCIYLMQCNDAPYQNLQQCEAQNTCYGVPDLAAAADAGAVVYDPSKVGQCNARFRSDPCGFATILFATDIFYVLSLCPGTLTPELKQGAACVSDGECGAGLYCQKPNGTCPGTCATYSTDGGPCDTNGQLCGQGLICESNACQPISSVGSPCMADGTCTATLCIGVDAAACQSLWCDKGTGTCVAGVGEGQPCGPNDAGSDVFCANNLSCLALVLNGTCVPPGGVGASCSSDLNCQPGLHCDGFVLERTFGECAAPSEAGAPCNGVTDCASGLFCKYDAQGLNGACSPPSALGDSCTSSDTDCQPGLSCQNSGTVNGREILKCVTRLYPPAACDDAGTSECVESVCKNGQCVNYANIGQACASSSDCNIGSCIDGTCVDTTVCADPGDGGLP